MEAVLCHGGSTIFCIVWYIKLYLDRLLVGSFTIEEEFLCSDYGITVAGFNIISPRADCIQLLHA